MHKFISGLAAAIVLTALSIGYLDVRVADFIFDHTGKGFQFSRGVASLPDMLFLTVLIVCSISWAGYSLLSRKGI